MDMVEAYLQAQEKIIQQDREETLIQLGITQREYSPNGEKTWQYNLLCYEDGEKRYYREIALPVSEEQWKAILEKKSAVAEIEERRRETDRQKQAQQMAGTVQTIVPIFESQSPLANIMDTHMEDANEGKSRIAQWLRGIGWLLGIISVLTSLIVAIKAKESTIFWITLGIATLAVLLFLTMAEILDRLANIQANMENGYKITQRKL